MTRLRGFRGDGAAHVQTSLKHHDPCDKEGLAASAQKRQSLSA